LPEPAPAVLLEVECGLLFEALDEPNEIGGLVAPEKKEMRVIRHEAKRSDAEACPVCYISQMRRAL
jgi:hypothetical protein